MKQTVFQTSNSTEHGKEGRTQVSLENSILTAEFKDKKKYTQILVY